jgi:uncharacterized protein (DUF1330 family)
LKEDLMPAYVISEVEVLDPAVLDRYPALAQASITRHGGRYILRGGAVEAIAGGPAPKLLVVVEFASMDAAKDWYRSPDYAEALALSKRALRRRLLFVEGVPPA